MTNTQPTGNNQLPICKTYKRQRAGNLMLQAGTPCQASRATACRIEVIFLRPGVDLHGPKTRVLHIEAGSSDTQGELARAKYYRAYWHTQSFADSSLSSYTSIYSSVSTAQDRTVFSLKRSSRVWIPKESPCITAKLDPLPSMRSSTCICITRATVECKHLP